MPLENIVSEKRKRIFVDTMKICEENKVVEETIQFSKKSQFIVFEGPMLADGPLKHRFNKSAAVVVSKKRSYEAAEPYSKSGRRVCVLNFANAFHAGGGVKSGCGAQEECLCRCSTLYKCLTSRYILDRYHNLHSHLRKEGRYNNCANDDCIYTPEVLVLKTDTSEPQIMPEEDWYKVDVITCAAPDLRGFLENPTKLLNAAADYRPSEDEMLQIHIKRGRRILEIAKRQNVDAIILGAFGCGAFQNSPETVARAYKEILPEYEHDFETIEFAIAAKDDSDVNYSAFKKILQTN